MSQDPSLRSICVAAASVFLVSLPLAVQSQVAEVNQTVFFDGLESPWDMAFLPDGTMFFTEKCKGLSVQLPDDTVNSLLGMGGTDGYAMTADDLFCDGQAGMNGVTLDPGFAENGTIYVYSASRTGGNPAVNRVLRLTVSQGPGHCV